MDTTELCNLICAVGMVKMTESELEISFMTDRNDIICSHLPLTNEIFKNNLVLLISLLIPFCPILSNSFAI
jgi:hypothetical protein